MTKNTNQGLTMATRFGVIRNLTVDEAAALAKLINEGVDPETVNVKKVMYIGNIPFSGTILELAAMVIAQNEQPNKKIPKGWEALLFRRDESGKVYVQLPERNKPHFVLAEDASFPPFLLGMFAVVLKKIGISQDQLNTMFGKPAEGTSAAKAAHENGKPEPDLDPVRVLFDVSPVLEIEPNGSKGK